MTNQIEAIRVRPWMKQVVPPLPRHSYEPMMNYVAALREATRDIDHLLAVADAARACLDSFYSPDFERDRAKLRTLLDKEEE